MNINFKAQKLNSTSIFQLKQNSAEYIKKPVSFIKFDLKSSSDLISLKKMNSLWPYTFARSMYKSIQRENNAEIYALTLQTDKFEKIECKKILGLAETIKIDDNSVHLEFLQTHPDYKHKEFSKQISFYKGIGSALINSIKNLKYVDKITTNSLFIL